MNILSYLLPVPAVVGASVVGGRVGGAVVVGFPPGPPLRPGIQENLKYYHSMYHKTKAF